jgi:hypothetical protein
MADRYQFEELLPTTRRGGKRGRINSEEPIKVEELRNREIFFKKTPTPPVTIRILRDGAVVWLACFILQTISSKILKTSKVR